MHHYVSYSIVVALGILGLFVCGPLCAQYLTLWLMAHKPAYSRVILSTVVGHGFAALIGFSIRFATVNLPGGEVGLPAVC